MPSAEPGTRLDPEITTWVDVRDGGLTFWAIQVPLGFGTLEKHTTGVYDHKEEDTPPVEIEVINICKI